MPQVRLVAFVCLAVLAAVLLAPTAAAQSCFYFSQWNYAIRSDADTCDPGNVCPPGRTITFVVFGSSNDLACVKDVEWNMGDGTPPTTMQVGTPIRKAYAVAGNYKVQAKLTSTATPASTVTLEHNVAVGSGLVTIVPQPYSETTAQERDGVARIKVRKSNAAGATSVQWRATPGTAMLGVRYTTETGAVTIPDGATEADIVFPLINDNIRNGDQSLTLGLISANNGFVLGTPSSLTLRIVDDEPPPTLGFSAPTTTVLENAGTAVVRVIRTGDLAGTVSCVYSVPEYLWNSPWVEPTSGTLIFGPNESEKTISVRIRNDYLSNGTRTVGMRLESPSGGVTLAPYSAQLEILDDEPRPTISIEDVSIVEGSAGFTTATFRLTRSPAFTGDGYLPMTWGVTGGTAMAGRDYPASSGFLFFSSGETEKTFTFQVRGDLDPEQDETVTIRLAIDSFYLERAVCGRDTVTLTILNDDAGMAPATLRLPRGQTQEAMIDLGSPTAQARTILLRTDTLGVAEFPSSVEIPAGGSRAVFRIKALAVGVAGITATMPEGWTGPPPAMSVIVYEAGRLVFSPASVSAFAGRDVTVGVSLDPPSTKPQTIALQSAGAVASVPASVVIPPGGTGTFVVKAIKRGGTSIAAKMPDEYGGETVPLMVDVTDAPDGPALAAVVPMTGPHAGGTAFEASGSKLTADCRLLFGGVPATQQRVVSATQITGVTPRHAPGTVAVELDCNAGRFALPGAFTFIASAPSLRSVAPGFGNVSGGTHVRATGANLYSGCWLFFGDAPARAVTTIGTTEMTGLAPAGKAGSVDVSVRCGQQAAVLRSAFAYTSADEPSPSVSSVDPLIGAAGEHVTITGLRFRPTDRIAFDNAPATILRTSPESHVVRIPELPLGRTAIQLTDAAGRLSTTGPIFRIIEATPPRIGTVTPARAFAGSEVLIEGSGFRPGYAFAVGSATARVISLEFGRAVIRLATGTPGGNHQIDVLNASQQLAAVGPFVEVLTGGPAVLSASPACGSSDGGTELTLTGSGFAAGATVMFNGVAAVTSAVGPTEIRLFTPAGATGAAVITVTNPNGDGTTNSDAFRYVSPFDPDAVCTGSRARNVRH